MLIVGGLTFLVLSMIYGSITSTYLDHFSQERKDALRNGFLDQLSADTNAIRYEDVFRTAAQHRSSHSHLSNFGLIALALGIGVKYINLPERWLKFTAISFLLGGFVLPFGIFLEPIYNKEIGSLMAMVGGILVTLATAIFLLGAYRAKSTND